MVILSYYYLELKVILQLTMQLSQQQHFPSHTSPSQTLFFFARINKHINHWWQTLWQSFPNNKLYKIHSSISTIQPIHSFNCKDQVLINQLMIGHTRLTHYHLLSKEPPPTCTYCSTLLTVEHILTNCSHYQTIRHKYYQYSDLSNIFQLSPQKSLIQSIKEINLYHQFCIILGTI